MAVRLKALKPQPFSESPQTLGGHLKKRRLEGGFTQAEAAHLLGVSAATVLSWETEKVEPEIRYMPAIIQFLGYDPFPAPTTLSERMLAKRRQMGWSIKEAAAHLGVNEGTWAEWEQSGVVAWTRYREALYTFLLASDTRLR